MKEKTGKLTKDNRHRKRIGKLDLQNMKLASKTAAIIGSLIFAIFLVFICITIVITRKSLIAAIDSEFKNMAEKNAVKVQMPIDNATQMAADLQQFCEDSYNEYYAFSSSDPQITDKEQSEVYDVQLNRYNQAMEDYFINTISSAVMSNDDIMGAGLFFEPGAFDPAVEDYTMYISETEPDKIQSYGEYENYKDAVYYAKAKESKTAYFTPPYEESGVYVISAAYPILYNNEVQGVISVDINAGNFAKIMETDDRYPTMYQDILTEDGTIVFDSTEPTGKYVGVNLGEWLSSEANENMISLMGQGQEFMMRDKNQEGTVIQRYFYPIQAGNQVWWALMGVDQLDKEEAVYTTILWMGVIAAAAVLIIITVSYSVLRRMINPIGRVVEAAKSIAEGDFNIQLEASTNDEIGTLTKAFGNTAETLRLVIQDISAVLNGIADGNLAVAPSARYVGELSEIERSVTLITDNLNQVLKNINKASESVSSGSSQIAEGAQSLAEGATDQASSIQELQATVTSISSQVDKNAQNADGANDVARQAGETLEQGNEQMKNMLEAMTEINNASNDIKKVIGTIEDIAEQTNLLSLNASIEAARAGEAGKGFAVVADQVGKLASESANATKNTALLIEASIKAVEKGIQIANATAKAIDDSVEKVNEVVSNVRVISDATGEQARALEQVSQGVEQISCVIQENSAMAEESASASEELSAQAQILDELVREFKLRE